MKKLDLSDAKISSLSLPVVGKQKVSYSSTFISGLSLIIQWRNGVYAPAEVVRASPHEYLRFFWRYRYTKANGKRSSIDLGFWPTLKQDEAVEEARHVLSAAQGGHDVIQEKRLEQEITLPKFSANSDRKVSYLMLHFLAWRQDKHRQKLETNDFYEKKIKKHVLPRWGLYDCEAVTPWAWQEYIRQLAAEKSHSLAKQVHASWRAAFSYATQSDNFPMIESNPYLGLKVVKELKVKVGDRYLDNEELHKWMNEINSREEPTQTNILMLQLYQGIRISEVLNIKISDLKLLHKSEIPIIVKGQRSSRMMLSSQAIELIKSQLQSHVDNSIKSKYLFPHHDSIDQPYTHHTAHSFVKKVRKDWIEFSTHDLRRTMRTWLQHFGCPKEMRDRLSNHVLPTGKDASYDHASLRDTELRWTQLWADKLDIIKKDPEAFKMDIDTAVDKESADEISSLLQQLS